MGSRSALLDALAWTRSALASRARPATEDGEQRELAALAPVIAERDPVESWGFERCFRAVIDRAPGYERAASALASSDRAWLDAALRARIAEGGPRAAEALEPVLSLLGSTRESSDHLIVWAEEASPERRAALLLARARSGALSADEAPAWLALAAAQPWSDASFAECLRALLAAQPALAAELLFERLHRGQRPPRAEYERALLAMTSHFEPRFVRWIEDRLASGSASAWELDALDRWMARNRRTRGV